MDRISLIFFCVVMSISCARPSCIETITLNSDWVGVERVEKSVVNCTNITSVDQILHIKTGVSYDHVLNITNSTIASLPTQSLSKLTTVTELCLSNNHIKSVSTNAFANLTKLWKLYLDNNELTVIPNGMFSSLEKLQILNLANNKIHTIEKFAFLDIKSLEELYLECNNITNVDHISFETIKSLHSLNFSRNHLKRLSLNGLKTVNTLTVIHNANNRMKIDLSNLTVSSLDLSFSRLINVNLKHLPKIQSISSMSSVYRHLYITESRIVGCPSSGSDGCTINSFINFEGSQLTYINEPMVNAITKVDLLDFSSNIISKIDKNALQGLTRLCVLYLQRNNIKQIDQSLFRDLKNLKFLNLSFNNIENIHYGTFDNLANLRVLDISSNRLVDLPQYTFHSFTYLLKLFFDKNQITSFNVNDLIRYNNFLCKVSFDENMWECKNLVEMARVLREKRVTILSGKSLHVENYHGIACTSRNDSKLRNTYEAPSTSSNTLLLLILMMLCALLLIAVLRIIAVTILFRHKMNSPQIELL